MTEKGVLNLVKNIIPKMRKSRQKTLSASVSGCLMNPRGRLTDMARGMRTQIKLRDRLKRISRFLGNSGIVVEELAPDFFRWLIHRQGPLLPVVVLIDWTREHSQNVLMLSIKWGMRSIPFYWCVVRDGELKGKQVQIETKALRLLRQWVSGRQIIVIADRGFERKAFYEALKKYKLDYIVRSKGTTCIFEKGEKYQLLKIRLRGEKERDLKNILFSNKIKMPMRVVAKKTKVKGKWSTWYLTTSLKTEPSKKIIEYYKRRMGIEATFKDMKTTLGWRFQNYIKCSTRLERYILIIVMSIIAAMVTSERKTGHRNRFKVSLEKAWRETEPVSFVQLGIWLIQKLPSQMVMIHHRKDWSYAV